MTALLPGIRTQAGRESPMWRGIAAPGAGFLPIIRKFGYSGFSVLHPLNGLVESTKLSAIATLAVRESVRLRIVTHLCGTIERSAFRASRVTSPRCVVRGSPTTVYNRATEKGMCEQQVKTMRIGLFVPCYIDQLYPDVALATLELLEKAGMEVEFPAEQTCCGQPMANTGCQRETRPLALKFLKIFRDYPYVVCPSGSCVAMVRHHYREHLAGQPGFEELVGKTYELCEFLVDVLKHGTRDRFVSATRLASTRVAMGCVACGWPVPANWWDRRSARCGTCWSGWRDPDLGAGAVGRMLWFWGHVLDQ